MPRKLRRKYAGATYHVMNRGDEGNAIFLDDRDKGYFVKLLAMKAAKYSASIYSYCLTSNHYHLALKTSENNISELMHYMDSSFGSHMARKGWIGHVFAGRFKSLCVERDDYMVVLNRYISLNPVEAGLVARPEHYPWSSYKHYCREDIRCQWIDQSWLLDYFGSSLKEARRAFRRFVESPLDQSWLPRDLMLRDAIEGDARSANAVEGLERKPLVDLELVERLVLEHYALDDLKKDGRSCGEELERARRVFTLLSKENTNAKNKEISSRIGLTHPSGITHKYKQMLKALDEDSGDHDRDKADIRRIEARIEELSS